MIYLLQHTIDIAAERSPEHPAVKFNNQTLSYAELATQTNRLAHALIDQGIKTGDRVGIYLHKSIYSAIAIYGIMKAGAAYVPLDPSAPVSRTALTINDCEIRHLISEPAKQSAIDQMISDNIKLDCIIGLDQFDHPSIRSISWNQIESLPGVAPPDLNIIEQDLAYIMYTSGSTGAPKGIMHNHHSGLSYAYWAAHEYHLTQEDKLTNHAPLHFDLSTFDFFAGAVARATTVIIPEETLKMPASYSKLLANEQITIFFTVPFALIQLLLRGVLEIHDLTHLRWIIFGGEPFPPKHLQALMTKLPTARFSNIYGPAEVNGVTFYHVPPILESPDQPIPIGKLCPNVQAMILDTQDQPVTNNQPGELLIRSPTMMQGYWQRPDLNAQAFYFNTISDHYRHTYYRTGDLVQIQPDGNYCFLGRKDRQIKTRGYRVELDEVEAALVTHPHIEEAAAYPVSDDQGSNHIHATITLHSDREVTTNQLIKHASKRLPWYAVPIKFTVTNSFPRTTSGKIDRRALAQQASSG